MNLDELEVRYRKEHEYTKPVYKRVKVVSERGFILAPVMSIFEPISRKHPAQWTRATHRIDALIRAHFVLRGFIALTAFVVAIYWIGGIL